MQIREAYTCQNGHRQRLERQVLAKGALTKESLRTADAANWCIMDIGGMGFKRKE